MWGPWHRPSVDGQCPILTLTCPRILSPWLLVLPPPSIPLVILILSVTRRCHPDIPLPVQPSWDVTPFPARSISSQHCRSGGVIWDSPKECIGAGFPLPLQHKTVQGQSLGSPTSLRICLSLCHPSPVLIPSPAQLLSAGIQLCFRSLGSGFPSTHGSS